MLPALLGVGQHETMGSMNHPSVHHGAGQFGVKLHGPGVFTIAESLVRIDITCRQEPRAMRQAEALAVEVVDHLWPMHQQPAVLRGVDGIPADFGAFFTIGLDLAPEVSDQHLGAEADAEKRFVFLEGHVQPVDLGLDVSSGSFALIGPPKTTTPAWSPSVLGRSWPSTGRRMSSG